jgi:flagellar biosynthesis/type III secretory pathway protein FliH
VVATVLRPSAEVVVAEAVATRVARVRNTSLDEATLATLACDVARTVLAREAATSYDVVRDVARQALARLRRARALVLRVHPAEVAAVEAAAMTWLPKGALAEVLRVVADETVERGGVVVESEHGRIDARLQRQLDEIARILAADVNVV